MFKHRINVGDWLEGFSVPLISDVDLNVPTITVGGVVDVSVLPSTLVIVDGVVGFSVLPSTI